MADAWLPGVGRMPVKRDGGALRGGAPRVVWFSSESDPRTISARSVAADLAHERTPVHLVWNPCSGELVQQIPITRAGGLLEEPVRHEGRRCVQVLVVAQAHDPFTGTLLRGLDLIMAWLDAWDVARRWPAGPPLPPPQSYDSGRERRDWARGGHFGASQVPGRHRPDPGGIDIRRITGPDTPVTAVPRQRPIPTQDMPGPAAPSDPGATPRDPAGPSPEPLPLPLQEPAAANVPGSGSGSNGTRLPAPVPRPRAAEPVGAAASPSDTGSLVNGTQRSSPLATTAPAAPTPAATPSTTPVPEPASMRY